MVKNAILTSKVANQTVNQCQQIDKEVLAWTSVTGYIRSPKNIEDCLQRLNHLRR